MNISEVAMEALKKSLKVGHELADGLQSHEDSQYTLDWIHLEHEIKLALSQIAKNEDEK